ncbi:type II toxin-antitoxin system VapC family toxin [Bacillus niameyensis]|uniref:type II toxin-antitoxin system VapC family toxin n=1 Tax=Bacillus niameyensis TaxID=1522308 RepID=UPI00078308E6|nr:type II toxin-antitoxin system VapC family toxin [Bacillus niameyensis]
MDFIIGGEQVDQEDFSGASIYLDACFILAFLDLDDDRRPEVARVLDVWSDHPGVILGVSNHTIAEVINRLFQMNILGALETYHRNNKLINQTRDGLNKLSFEQRIKLLDIDGIRFLYGLAKREEIISFYNKNINIHVKVMELIKLAKKDEENRKKLDVFYRAAVDTFEEFIHMMTVEAGFEVVEILDSTGDISYFAATVFMKQFQLDITDSFHLAIAQENEYNYLATLDGDFLNHFYSREASLSTRIIKVA